MLRKRFITVGSFENDIHTGIEINRKVTPLFKHKVLNASLTFLYLCSFLKVT